MKAEETVMEERRKRESVNEWREGGELIQHQEVRPQ